MNSLIYDGTSPDSKIVGLMYYSVTPSPAGFAGPNDHWHRHSNVVCIRNGPNGIEVPFPADADVTASSAAAAGGRLMPVTGWMVHAWVVPGWESPLGVFSHDNPNLRCADGTYDTEQGRLLPGKLICGVNRALSSDAASATPEPTSWVLPDPADAPQGERSSASARISSPARCSPRIGGGLFPMRLGASGPLAWWSPDPRGVLPLDGLRREPVAAAGRRRRFESRSTRRSTAVMRGCGDPRAS